MNEEYAKRRLGNLAAWLSAASLLVYFFSNYAVKNYFIFVIQVLNKTSAMLLR